MHGIQAPLHPSKSKLELNLRGDGGCFMNLKDENLPTLLDYDMNPWKTASKMMLCFASEHIASTFAMSKKGIPERFGTKRICWIKRRDTKIWERMTRFFYSWIWFKIKQCLLNQENRFCEFLSEMKWGGSRILHFCCSVIVREKAPSDTFSKKVVLLRVSRKAERRLYLLRCTYCHLSAHRVDDYARHEEEGCRRGDTKSTNWNE